MSKSNIKTYDKQKSFINLYVSKNESEVNILKKIKRKLYDKKILSKLNNYQIKILNIVRDDLFKTNLNKKSIFKLTPNILNELKLIDENDIPKYLFHRYRYDIFPETYQVDDYPPYLQIEPTSFCNYRCVFCFQTNKDFTKRSNGYMGKMKLDFFILSKKMLLLLCL